jgi:alkylhydroperoxidase family enzyme
VGRQQGLTDAKLSGLPDFETNAAYTALESAVLQYAVAMTETPVNVSDELFAKLRENFNDRQLVELTSSIAWQNYRSRYDHAFGVESEGFVAE